MDRTARNGATESSEVSERPRRRRFEAAYKLRVLEERIVAPSLANWASCCVARVFTPRT